MKDITGIMIYYYFVCPKKLWYFANELVMEQNSELVAIGKVIDETTYTKEKKNILIDDTINVDFVDNEMTLHEVKKTKAIEEAGIWQTKIMHKKLGREVSYEYLIRLEIYKLIKHLMEGSTYEGFKMWW